MEGGIILHLLLLVDIVTNNSTRINLLHSNIMIIFRMAVRDSHFLQVVTIEGALPVSVVLVLVVLVSEKLLVLGLVLVPVLMGNNWARTHRINKITWKMPPLLHKNKVVMYQVPGVL